MPHQERCCVGFTMLLLRKCRLAHRCRRRGRATYRTIPNAPGKPRKKLIVESFAAKNAPSGDDAPRKLEIWLVPEVLCDVLLRNMSPP